MQISFDPRGPEAKPLVGKTNNVVKISPLGFSWECGELITIGHSGR